MIDSESTYHVFMGKYCGYGIPTGNGGNLYLNTKTVLQVVRVKYFVENAHMCACIELDGHSRRWQISGNRNG